MRVVLIVLPNQTEVTELVGIVFQFRIPSIPLFIPCLFVTEKIHLRNVCEKETLS